MATKTRRLADFLANIDDDSKVTSTGLLDATITATDLAPNSVDSSELVDGAVDTSHIANDAVDADNRLLWRMNRRRLDVEPWRDAMLAVSGNLDRALGGVSQHLDEAANRRRTLYGFVSRHKLNELLRLFDFPDPNITSDRRASTTVPLQQLFVLNSDFMTRQARSLALHLVRDVPAGGVARIRRAYELLFARAPTAEEVAVGLEFLDQVKMAGKAESNLSGWEQYALGLLASNEFTYID